MLNQKGLTAVKGNIGSRIKRLRDQRGWSQRELAKHVDMNHSVLSRIESNKRPVTTEELNKFAEVFEVHTDYLSGFTKTDLSPEAQDFIDILDMSEEDAISKIQITFTAKGKGINLDQARMIYYLALGVVKKD